MSNRHHFKNSSSLVHVDYDDDKGTMEICFASGGTYHYPNCDKAHYENLKQAASAGQYFHRAIRNLPSKKVS